MFFCFWFFSTYFFCIYLEIFFKHFSCLKGAAETLFYLLLILKCLSYEFYIIVNKKNRLSDLFRSIKNLIRCNDYLTYWEHSSYSIVTPFYCIPDEVSAFSLEALSIQGERGKGKLQTDFSRLILGTLLMHELISVYFSFLTLWDPGIK